MKKIGLLGGTFNPVHLGHLVIAQEAVESLKLDEIYFIPSDKKTALSSLIEQVPDLVEKVADMKNKGEKKEEKKEEKAGK